MRPHFPNLSLAFLLPLRVVNPELNFERGIFWVSLREVIGLYGLIVSLILNTAVGTMQVCPLVSLFSYLVLTSGS